MTDSVLNKRKILNDPIYGFIDIPHDILFDVIEHPYFQRLRRIRQLGLTNLVYPGTNHTRFQHAMGAMHLMQSAINVIRSKGHEITEEEEQAALLAILLHDVGHGPFSHALETTIIEGIKHEAMSLLLMENLNEHFNNRLSLAIKIFKGTYPKKFLSQLVSSQLDMDRLDYLKRDSFFSGVIEGSIGSDRIIKMLNVYNDNLVVEAKGIYSIEKYLIARRFMYWQVYLHKTVLSAENLLIKVLQRAKELARKGEEIYATEPLHYFLYLNKNVYNGFKEESIKDEIIKNFTQLDDSDIIVSLKQWMNNNDTILSVLSDYMVNRKLYKTEIYKNPVNKTSLHNLKKKAEAFYKILPEETDFFVFTGVITNNAYNSDEKIQILLKNNELLDVAEASDSLYLASLSTDVKKYFICYTKDCI